ncbi:MAG: hypothetical protein ABI810_14745 [Sphingomonas bacterium]
MLSAIIVNIAALVSAQAIGTKPPENASLASSPAVEACSAWFSGRTSSSDPAVHPISADSFCFDGVIDARGSTALIGQLKSIPNDRPMTMVVRSGGGGISESLDVADVLIGRNATVIVHTLCGSGCANNLFLPARRRIILNDALVAFHGGASLSLADKFDRDKDKVLAANPQADFNRLSREWRQSLTRDIARQDAMLKSTGIDADFFSWFDRMATLPASSQSPDCAANAEAEAIVFSEDFLRKRGVHIAYNGGARSAEDLRRLNDKRGWGRGSCFWQ